MSLHGMGWGRRARVGAFAAACFAGAGCADAEDRGPADSVVPTTPGATGETTSAASASTPDLRRDTLGLTFDPPTVKVGDTLGGLRVGRVDVARAADDMGYVGNVRFDGEVTIAGERMTHPDYPDIKEICMRVDSASAVRLPRFPGDQRRRWLCFENRDAAARQLGPAGTEGPLTVIVDRYQTVRHFSDVYDTATLVRVVQEQRVPSNAGGR